MKYNKKLIIKISNFIKFFINPKLYFKKIKDLFLEITIIFRIKIFFKRPKRIAMACSTGIPGGAETVFVNHVKFLSTKFNDIDVFYSMAGGSLVEKVKKFANNIYIRKGFDNIHLANYKYLYLVQCLPNLEKIKKMNPNIKVSFIVHDPISWIERLNKQKHVLKYIDHVFCISELVRESFIKNISSYPKDRISVLYNSLIFNVEYEENLNKSSNITTWGYAGRISPEKGVEEIVKNFIEFSKNNKNQRLIIAGDITADLEHLVEYKKEIKKLVKSVENIIMIGYQEDLIEFYKEIDFMIIGSYIEGISVAALDALASGVPVISSDVGSMHEVININNGVLFKLQNLVKNPFGKNKKLKYSDSDNESMQIAMKKALNTSWKRKEISLNIREMYGNDIIKKEICDIVDDLIKTN